MNRPALRVSLKRHEGTGPFHNGRFFPYLDTATPPRVTIGYGHNLSDGGVPKEQADAWLEEDIDRAFTGASTLFSPEVWLKINDARANVLVEMVFNLGPGAVQRFYHMLAAVHDGAWDEAATAMLDSKWARQVGARAQEMARVMREGTL